ncbi:MAG: hypothetical protein R2713_18285 [Ilumatobacteraceae bacterium]
MERSGPDDARDDAWDDESYPPAPLPPHERAWRHPSELAHSEWVRSEPPVAVGRGLLVTTGAIGSALGVAVLYLMLPTGAGGPTASPTVTSSIAALRPPASTAMVVERDVRSGDDSPGADVVWLDSPGLTLPVLDVPSTVLVLTAPDRQQQPLSVAVSIEGRRTWSRRPTRCRRSIRPSTACRCSDPVPTTRPRRSTPRSCRSTATSPTSPRRRRSRW